jgi:hypothetical protein
MQVIEVLADVMLVRGIPEHIRSDNEPEFIAEEICEPSQFFTANDLKTALVKVTICTRWPLPVPVGLSGTLP